MSEMIKIAVDAMGGDGSPKKIIDGIIHNHKFNNENFFRIFGDENAIEKLINNKIAKNFYEASGITARILLMEEKRENNRYRP